jgi:hypothetical protein
VPLSWSVVAYTSSDSGEDKYIVLGSLQSVPPDPQPCLTAYHWPPQVISSFSSASVWFSPADQSSHIFPEVKTWHHLWHPSHYGACVLKGITLHILQLNLSPR